MEVRRLNLLRDILPDELVLNRLVGGHVVVTRPLAQRPLRQTRPVIVLAPPRQPVPFELGRIVAAGLGRLRAEVHPQLEVLLARTDIVETPADQVMVEQTLSFKGNYFVLMGRISPLDGMGPNEIHFDRLLARIETPDTGVPIREVVLATNFTSEGEATAHYIGEVLKVKGIKVTRIARGIPVGGELEYVDAGTLARALMDRR